MSRIHIYFREQSESDRWLPGDRFIISPLRRLIRGHKVSGVKKVFINLCKGFDELHMDYTVNNPFDQIRSDEPVIILGAGKYALEGYQQPNRIIAGIGLMTHPSHWPDLYHEFPIVRYLQHSPWANDIYERYYGPEKCGLWPAGIDTRRWYVAEGQPKTNDVLVYNKIRWNHAQLDTELRLPLLDKLEQLGLSYQEITYGSYKETDYFELLKKSKSMVFLCEHESQGFACCEALSADVPVFAWDQGLCLDPERFKWNDPVIPATSVPFFNEGCGMTFRDYTGFEKKINSFWEKVQNKDFHPRAYVMENLTLKKSAEKMLDIIREFYPHA